MSINSFLCIQINLLIVIIWLMDSFWAWLKVIPLSDVYCIYKVTYQGECLAAVTIWKAVPRDEVRLRPHTREIICQETTFVALNGYSRGSRIAKYWSTPEKGCFDVLIVCKGNNVGKFWLSNILNTDPHQKKGCLDVLIVCKRNNVENFWLSNILNSDPLL